MDSIVYFVIFGVLWMIFGSFWSVILHRLKTGETGIATGRSHCTKCGHTLGIRDLFPIFSWLSTGGKCRYCHAPISSWYPSLEIVSAFVFVLLADTWRFLSVSTLLSLVILLAVGWVWFICAAYDFKYTEIPDAVIVPAIIMIFWWELLALFTSIESGLPSLSEGSIWAIGIYGFFVLQILLPAGWFYARKQEWEKLVTLIVESLLFPILMVREWIRPTREEAEEDKVPSWIGGGDLRLALFLGLTLWSDSLIALAVAYILGSVVGILLLIVNRKRSHIIPFGPFIAIGWLIAVILKSYWLATIAVLDILSRQ